MKRVDGESLSLQIFGKNEASLDNDEQAVLAGMEQRQPIAQDANAQDLRNASLGSRLADRVAAVGGSWGFIISFTAILLAWMLLNSDVLSRWNLAFDPYPYIFLNLMLSTVAAIQAPIIMMSQNRQSERDRIAATLDYQVNLRAELEILGIQEKIDAVIVAKLDEILARMSPGAKAG